MHNTGCRRKGPASTSRLWLLTGVAGLCVPLGLCDTLKLAGGGEVNGTVTYSKQFFIIKERTKNGVEEQRYPREQVTEVDFNGRTINPELPPAEVSGLGKSPSTSEQAMSQQGEQATGNISPDGRRKGRKGFEEGVSGDTVFLKDGKQVSGGLSGVDDRQVEMLIDGKAQQLSRRTVNRLVLAN
jgi:hypothetical protein